MKHIFKSMVPLHQAMMSFTFFVILFLGYTKAAVYQQGDTCGVSGNDVLGDNFTGSVAVAGNGCTLGNNSNCLCAPNLNDGGDVSDFIWQCNGTVEAGPIDGKVCPNTIPVPVSKNVTSSDSGNATESMLDVSITCNTTIHPTGGPGDPNCAYSDCESGGNFSAICGCFDLGSQGGMIWICLRSTCDCGDDASESQGDGATTEDEFTKKNITRNKTTSASVSSSFLLTGMQIIAVTSSMVVMSLGF
jgi:hypothetical protein